MRSLGYYSKKAERLRGNLASDALAVRAARLVIDRNHFRIGCKVRAARRDDDVIGIDAQTLTRPLAEVEMRTSTSCGQNPPRKGVRHPFILPESGRHLAIAWDS
jgi:hypothetical protein